MRGRPTIAVFALALCPLVLGAAEPQPEAVMTIAGIPGQISIRADRTDWSQIQGMPDPRTSQGSEITSIMGSRESSLLSSRGESGGERDRGSAQIGDLSVDKYIDKASPKLHDKVLSGERIPEVRIEIIPSAREQRTRFIIKMTNVVIKHIVEQPATGRDRPTEIVTFTCEKLEWESWPDAAAWRVSTPPYTRTPRPP